MMMRSRTQRLAAGAAAALAVMFATVFGAPAAGAHGGPIKIVVVSPTGATSPVAGTPVTYEVAFNFIEDGDPIDGGTVTLVATKGGDRVGPIPLAPTGTAGHFSGAVTFPSGGDWSIRVTSVEPDGSLAVTNSVKAGATTTIAVTTKADESSSKTPLIIGGVVLAALVAGGVLVAVRRSGGQSGGEPSS